MEEMNLEKEMAVHCGKVTDSMETLESLCQRGSRKASGYIGCAGRQTSGSPVLDEGFS